MQGIASCCSICPPKDIHWSPEGLLFVYVRLEHSWTTGHTCRTDHDVVEEAEAKRNSDEEEEHQADGAGGRSTYLRTVVTFIAKMFVVAADKINRIVVEQGSDNIVNEDSPSPVLPSELGRLRGKELTKRLEQQKE
ncbi:hypothetical protein PsorP6_009160 [Peronosclerospora sorghi]|uniref:Uncharacterized protein n=1 Tax=Peronosclerospora sorghi TaxID=230839 RepID=A0ACC0VXG1_9STRA|nr:hypothetical protein PsorP6_009160 [Peronosclerospora sorghi]